MSDLSVNSKGTLGLSKVISDLVSKGYEVFTPFSDHAPVDIIVCDENFIPKRIQVKYRKVEPGYKINIPRHSVVNQRKVGINLDFIDGWAVYNPESDKVYYISKEQKIMRFRLDSDVEKMNKKSSSVPLASTLLDEKIFWRVN